MKLGRATVIVVEPLMARRTEAADGLVKKACVAYVLVQLMSGDVCCWVVRCVLCSVVLLSVDDDERQEKGRVRGRDI